MNLQLTASAKQPPDRTSKPVVWLLLFSMLAMGFFFIEKGAFFQRWVALPLARGSSSVTEILLSFLGVPAIRDGAILQVRGQVFAVAESCTGLSVLFLFFAAVISYPTRPLWRMIGVLAGGVLLLILNLIRTVMLVLVTIRFPNLFWQMHVIAGQALMLAGTGAIFVFWLKGAGAPGLTAYSVPVSLTAWGGLRPVLLFAVVFPITWMIYRGFTESSAGAWLQIRIIHDTAWILSLVMKTSTEQTVIHVPGIAINLVPQCLKSPLIVLFLSGIAVYPADWKKRVVAYAFMFIPLYYGYHVLRSLFSVLSHHMGGGALVADFLGQVVVMAGLALLFRQNDVCTESEDTQTGVSWPASAANWLRVWVWPLVPTVLVGACIQKLVAVVLWLTTDASMTWCPAYDPNGHVTALIYFHLYFWGVLTAPRQYGQNVRGWYRIVGDILIGCHYAVLVICIEILELYPEPFILKGLFPWLPFILMIGGQGRRKRVVCRNSGTVMMKV